MPVDGFVITHNSIVLPFVHEQHHNPVHHPSNEDSSHTECSQRQCLYRSEQPPVQIRIYGTGRLDNCRARKQVSNEYFDTCHDEFDQWSQFPCDDQYRLVHWCVKHILSRAAINELITNPTMVTISNLSPSHPSLERLNKMSYVIGIDSWTSSKVCYNDMADPKNLRNDDYLYCNPVECFVFLVQHPAFREHMLYGPAKELNDADEHIYSEVTSNNW